MILEDGFEKDWLAIESGIYEFGVLLVLGSFLSGQMKPATLRHNFCSDIVGMVGILSLFLGCGFWKQVRTPSWKGFSWILSLIEPPSNESIHVFVHDGLGYRFRDFDRPKLRQITAHGHGNSTERSFHVVTGNLTMIRKLGNVKGSLS